MDALRIDCAQRIEAIARELTQLAQRLAGSRESQPAPEPPDISQTLKENRCLYCGKVVDKQVEQYRRGLCVKDYQAITGSINKKQTTEEEMVLKGWLQPGRKKPGKQPQDRRLEEFIAQKGLGDFSAKLGEAKATVIHANNATPTPTTPTKKKPAKQ
jgi:hypothetical protein